MEIVEVIGCKFCKYKDSSDRLYEYSSWDGGVEYNYVKMNFCPECGRDLREADGEVALLTLLKEPMDNTGNNDGQ